MKRINRTVFVNNDQRPRPLVVVTYATDDQHLQAARVLFCTLERHEEWRQRAQFRVLVPIPFFARALETFATDRVIAVANINANAPTFGKLHAWTLDAWDFVLFIDCDAFVLDPIALLRALPTTRLTKAQIVAAPDPAPPDTINTGLFLIKPNRTIAAGLEKLRNKGDRTDQDVVNRAFRKGWYGTSRMLEARFNWHAWMSANNVSALGYDNDDCATCGRVVVVHYSGAKNKPWLYMTPQRRATLSDAWQRAMRPWWSMHAVCGAK
jgi:hypothetical protein